MKKILYEVCLTEEDARNGNYMLMTLDEVVAFMYKEFDDENGAECIYSRRHIE